ncbi:MAG TPA: TonB-dependent receptor [Longimicrobium sp.]
MRVSVIAALTLISAAVELPAQQRAEGNTLLHGFVREEQTGEPVSLASVAAERASVVRTSGDGYFTVRVSTAGPTRVTVRALGFAPLDTLLSPGIGPVELRLRAAPLSLAGVVVRASRALERPFETPEVSVRTVTPAEIRRVPAALEADLFRSIQALPGVVSPSVLSSRLLVRGGAADQNLFLLDGYPVLQPYHLGGGFSAFHTEAVRDAELWTGAPPARFGGALSSVLNVSLREGNRERTAGTATLGLITSSAVVEGGHPLGAWFVGARRTYLDALGRTGELPYYFYDGYAKTHVDVTPSDRLSALVFLGRDAVYDARFRDERHFQWSNEVYGVSWRHLFGGRAVLEHRLSLSRFGQELRGGHSDLQQSRVETDHRVSLLQFRGDLRWSPAGKHAIETGYGVERTDSEHRVAYRYGVDYDKLSERSGRPQGTLFSAYLQDDVTLTDRFRVRLGIRAETWDEDLSLQPRMSAKYLLTDAIALTAGGGIVRQYGQSLQDSDADLDVYSVDLAASAYEGDATAARSAHMGGGVEARLPHDLAFRAEAYAKRFTGLWMLEPYNPAALQFASDRLELGTGTARGLELSLAREGDHRVRGWVGYSLAASDRTVDGARFAADLLPRHRIVAVGETQARRGWTLTGRFEAMEGVPFTPSVWAVPDRPFDFATGGFSGHCSATVVQFVPGARSSARTGVSKRLDVGAGKRWTDRRGWKWELSLSLLNALLDPTGLRRPSPSHEQTGCNAPADVVWEREFLLPPVPSVGIRLEF